MRELFIILIWVITLMEATIKANDQCPPTITKQSEMDEVWFRVEKKTKTSYNLECEATGIPTPTFFWIKDGKEFNVHSVSNIKQKSNTGTLVIKKPTDADVGRYQCFAKNEHGVATSNPVNFRKAELESFNSFEKMQVKGKEGKPFNLSCNPPNGFPKPHIDWTMVDEYEKYVSIPVENHRLTVDPTGTLWFSNLTQSDKTDRFQYLCYVNSQFNHELKYGSSISLDVINSNDGSVNNIAPVQQYVTKKEEVAYRSKSIQLFCIFGGTPLPDITWTKDGQPLNFSSTNKFELRNANKTLIIWNINFTDEGLYSCNAFNSAGSKSHSINITVLSKPYFLKEPESKTVAEAETVEFTCEAEGKPNSIINWIHNGKPLEDAPVNPRRTLVDGKIIIKSLLKTDTGNYGCNASNSLGYVYKDFYVNVFSFPPNITEKPKNSQNIVNRNVMLQCKAEGAPRPIIKWFYNDKELSRPNTKVDGNGDLHIEKIQFTDSGNYTCLAENKLGQVKATAILEVKNRTFIKDGSKSYKFGINTDAILPCNVIFDKSLQPEVKWKNEAGLLTNKTKYEKLGNNSLKILKLSDADAGNYTCLVSTNLDSNQTSMMLHIQKVPHPPTLILYNCSKKHATISWTPTSDNGAIILYYNVIEFQNNNSIKLQPNLLNHTYKDLKPWTNYTFRITAVNKIGSSPPSNSQTCTTDPDVPNKNPDNVKARGTTPKILNITWTPMPENEHNGPNFYYRIYYKHANETEYKTHDIHDWKQNSFVVDNQLNLDQYKVKVVAGNSVGLCVQNPEEVNSVSSIIKPEKIQQQATPSLATTGWIVGIVALMSLLILVIIVVGIIVKRNNEAGVYNVEKKEKQMGVQLHYSFPTEDDVDTANSSGDVSEDDEAEFDENASYAGEYMATKKSAAHKPADSDTQSRTSSTSILINTN